MISPAPNPLDSFDIKIYITAYKWFKNVRTTGHVISTTLHQVYLMRNGLLLASLIRMLYNIDVSQRYTKLYLLIGFSWPPLTFCYKGLFSFIALFSTLVPLKSCFFFLSCRPFVVNLTFSTGLSVYSVSCLGQLTVNCQLPKPGDIRNFKTCWKYRVKDEKPTGNNTQLVSGTTVEN